MDFVYRISILIRELPYLSVSTALQVRSYAYFLDFRTLSRPEYKCE